ncbi:MAG: GTPase Era [Coriobacteriales bacterium]|jgi:GTP-binding protein Era|nr:GTPase Era [Coriobacteriales bacterium]
MTGVPASNAPDASGVAVPVTPPAPDAVPPAPASSGTAEVATPFKSGFLTLVGRPNAGKSTLLNTVMGQKVAIVSTTPQTTRHRFRAIVNAQDYQLVLVDTPGIHKPHDALGEELNRSAVKALEGIDVAAFVLDASAPFGSGDEWVLSTLGATAARRMLVVTKIDLVDTQTVMTQKDAAWRAAERLCAQVPRRTAPFDAWVALSARTGEHIDAFLTAASALLPEGPRWFGPDMQTDQPLEVLVAEFIREKLLHTTFEEVPHAIGVALEELSFDKRRKLHTIRAIIYVEHDSQKGIVIGKGGGRIKQVGSEARADLEVLLGTQVFLDLRVKVRRDWRRDANQIRRFGYGEGL